MKALFLIFPLLTYAQYPVEQKTKSRDFDVSIYEKKKEPLNEQAEKNSKIRCRYVCDKKLYKEQKISEAIEFYKNSKEYGFNKD